MSTGTSNNRKYGVIGYACDFGGTVSGSWEGPRALRALGLIKTFKELGADVIDYGDVSGYADPNDPRLKSSVAFHEEELRSKNVQAVHYATSQLYNLTRKVLEDGRIPFILGGDHSLSIGGVAAVSDYYQSQGKKIGLLWVDAHPDINIPSSSPSGRFFGMSVAILLGMVPGGLKSIQQHSPAVSNKDLAFIGLRDVDPFEREYLRENVPGASSMSRIDEEGIKHVINSALEQITKNTDGFVISFDLDACDPNFTPGTGTPKRGGLTYREAHYILETVATSGKLLGIELVEFNPSLDASGQTGEVAISLVESLLGKTVL